MTDTIDKINNLFLQFQSHGDNYKKLVGHGQSAINEYSGIFTKNIPHLLEAIFNIDQQYKISGSVGKGRITGCPWIAIMDKNETTSTQEGVYIVFLLSIDLEHVYITLAQGVTNTPMEKIIATRDSLRKKLAPYISLLSYSTPLQIANEKYKDSVIFCNEWNCSDANNSLALINEYKTVYEKYITLKGDDLGSDVKETHIDMVLDKNKKANTYFSISSIIHHIADTGLLYEPILVKRFAFSLMSKRFLILSGLAGSGKTQLALAFASALIESEQQMCVVSVGADWTNREPLLGFPNALQEGCYVKPECGALDLLIEANKEENKNKPFFLILDEMNMSYVERYFADFLSAMESHKPISLWNGNEGSEVPAKIQLPENLFIIGTINVDETTYMFSPKVLDRANVIEFKISEEEMLSFLTEMKDVHRDSINFKAAAMGASFVELAKNKEVAGNVDKIKQTLNSFFVNLKSVNAEFGYRSATEIYRFISQAEKNDDTDNKLTENQILDCAMVQKLLPKLHGSRKKLEPVLQALWKECFDSVKQQEILSIAKEHVSKASFPLTADKLQRMYEAAYANGFTSFAEA